MEKKKEALSASGGKTSGSVSKATEPKKSSPATSAKKGAHK